MLTSTGSRLSTSATSASTRSGPLSSANYVKINSFPTNRKFFFCPVAHSQVKSIPFQVHRCFPHGRLSPLVPQDPCCQLSQVRVREGKGFIQQQIIPGNLQQMIMIIYTNRQAESQQLGGVLSIILMASVPPSLVF